VSDLSVEIQSSAASVQLLLLSLTGKRVAASVAVRIAAKSPVEFLKYVLKGARITSYRISGSSERPTETLVLAFDQIHVQERDLGPDGLPAGWVKTGWDDLGHRVLPS
jgi:type VI protein secretion system component Hcp